MKEKEKAENVREEFSVEFGDGNGTKLLDLPLMGKNNSKKAKKKDKPV
ncbi:hypothetical protein ACF5W4_05705 [Bacillota bacterium Lsc_1132]